MRLDRHLDEQTPKHHREAAAALGFEHGERALEVAPSIGDSTGGTRELRLTLACDEHSHREDRLAPRRHASSSGDRHRAFEPEILRQVAPELVHSLLEQGRLNTDDLGEQRWEGLVGRPGVEDVFDGAFGEIHQRVSERLEEELDGEVGAPPELILCPGHADIAPRTALGRLFVGRADEIR